MSRGIYLRANGEINCYCSTGEQVSLAKLPLSSRDFDFVRDYYLSGNLAQLRQKMARGVLPHPHQCLKCNYLAPTGEFPAGLVGQEVEWIHLESAAVCNLRCPFCVHGLPPEESSYSRSAPHLLPPELYEKVLADLRRAGFSIKWMYFSGRGEPGLHPGLWRMVEQAKGMFDTNFLVNTNGNIPFSPGMVDSGLDKIKIALDSVDQDTYARYRAGGKAERVMELTRRIAEHKQNTGSASPQIIWQKVMFDFNDSDEELVRYQRRAAECGVDLIKLVYTWTREYSTRRPEELPRLFPAIEILDTFQRDNMPASELQSRLEKLRNRSGLESAVELTSRILHWLELGAEDRTVYDNFALLPVYDQRLMRLRGSEPDLGLYQNALIECLEVISREYKNLGEAEEAERYSGWAGKARREFTALS